jgi:uncharacterized membrane protein
LAGLPIPVRSRCHEADTSASQERTIDTAALPFAHVLKHLRAHLRLAISVAAGGAVAMLLPGVSDWVTRGLLGWNVAVWLYLCLIAWMMLHADHTSLRRVAVAQAESSAVVLVIVIVACIVSLFGTVAELMAAKLPGAHNALPHIVFALITLVGAWLLLPTMFTLTYASHFYRAPHGVGLQFPGADEAFRPAYSDFLYFSFTVAVAAQTADVTVTTSAMRRLVLLQSVLSFAFNTAILAFSINIAASLF